MAPPGYAESAKKSLPRQSKNRRRTGTHCHSFSSVSFFRYYFDIMKVFPAAQLEARRNGVMLDDLIAGLYTRVTLHLIIYWNLL
jgi:hypothetical protein